MADKEPFDVQQRLQDLKDEWAKSTGLAESAPPPGRTFEGMTVGDLIEWADYFVEADWANTLHHDADGKLSGRRLLGRIVHMHLGRWGWGLKMKVSEAPEGDPLKVGDEVFRWGDRLKYDGFKRILQ